MMQNVILLVVAYLFLQMCFVWVLYKIYNNPSIVDTSWSIGLMISGLIYLSSNPINLRKIIIASLLIAWALRLAGHLWLTRLRIGHRDKRYTSISREWKINPDLGFFLNFQLQSALIFIISFVFFFISLSPLETLSMVDVIAIMLILIGIFGESIADMQLEKFKKNYPGQVCDAGLWYYSRHPNYFFDWITWLGFALFGVQSSHGYFGFISIGVLYFIFTQITGPITERGSIQLRGEAYLKYQSSTSMFIPWFKY